MKWASDYLSISPVPCLNITPVFVRAKKIMLNFRPWALALHHANQNDFSAAATLAEEFLNSGGYEAQGHPSSIAAAYLVATDWARMANCDDVVRRLGLRALQAMEDRAMLRKMPPDGDLDKVVPMLGWLVGGVEG